MKTPLSSVKIILVEPAGALNVGSVARIMKNMGFSQLILVNPRCDYLGDEARKMAVHARDLLKQAQVVSSLPEALTGCQKAIATTGIAHERFIQPETPAQALPWLLENEASAALIFGREDRGLTNLELNYAQRWITIPTASDYTSLNLAQAVTVCLYQLSQSASLTSSLSESTLKNRQPDTRATFEELEGYYQHLETLLLAIRYLFPHTASARMEKFRRLYNRTELSSQEVAMLRGILSQVTWAIETQLPLKQGEGDA